ncbi:MAG: cohesin domain-containing protein [Dehalococcoidia bacterium]
MPATADTASVSISPAQVEVEAGELEDVTLGAQGVTGSGIGAFTIDISYDPAVVDAARCEPADGFICNVDFAPDTVRCGGFDPYGRTGDVPLCTDVEFEAIGAPGECSDITITVLEFLEVGGGSLAPALANGSFCIEYSSSSSGDTPSGEIPPDGTSDDTPSSDTPSNNTPSGGASSGGASSGSSSSDDTPSADTPSADTPSGGSTSAGVTSSGTTETASVQAQDLPRSGGLPPVSESATLLYMMTVIAGGLAITSGSLIWAVRRRMAGVQARDTESARPDLGERDYQEE